MRTWTEEARKHQSEIARRDRPWTRPTGPRTPEGKERSKYNALKKGYHSKVYRDLWRAARTYKRFIAKNLYVFTFERLRMHMIYEFELLSMICSFTVPEACIVKFSKNSLRCWLEKVQKETLYDYETLPLQQAKEIY